jgi:UDP-N-acetylmuramate dehydrogenase
MPLEPDSINWLASRFKDNVKFDEPMSRHTHFKVGGPADAFFAPKDIEELKQVVIWTKRKAISLLIIGDGTNLLVKDNGIRGMVAVLTNCSKKIIKKSEKKQAVILSAPAGAKLRDLCSFAIKSGLGGINYAVGIPGTVGGAITMNAGTANGSTEDVLEDVLIMLPDGKTQRINKTEIDFSYRNISFAKGHKTYQERPIILEGSFRLYPFDAAKLRKEAEQILKMRNKKQPIDFPSAGSFFKNPSKEKAAGRLIEQAGLKGKKIGGAQISEKHANFIINTGGAFASDILELMAFVQKTVFKTFNIELEPEVKIVGA